SGYVKLWDIMSGKERLSLQRQEGPMWGLAYAPDGKTLATAAHDSIVRLWDPATGKAQGEWKCKEVLSLTFSRDGTTLAAGSRDGIVRLWDVKTRRERKLPAPSSNIALSPDGKRLAAANLWSKTPLTLVWDMVADPPSVALRLPGAVCVAFSPDNQ